MPDRELLEKYPLYRRKVVAGDAWDVANLPRPAVNMHCGVCKSPQTFNMANLYWNQRDDNTQITLPGTSVSERLSVFRLVYRCASCSVAKRYFMVQISVARDQMILMKVGQIPEIDIDVNKKLGKFLGKWIPVFKKGRICEAQGYGIGAYAYYRRIVEEVIDELLSELESLIPEAERENYSKKLASVKQTHRAQDKIALVKDLLPESLQPDGINPLSVLHKVLSEGLHGRTDEECLEDAEAVREALLYLVLQVSLSRSASRNFTSKMRKFLDPKNR